MFFLHMLFLQVFILQSKTRYEVVGLRTYVVVGRGGGYNSLHANMKNRHDGSALNVTDRNSS
ncbi:unnamed protein product [Amoebophrya sp. A25]|nr:unnamed protein product [Amoebophrya sp. A25]|eukprot:GSA25T00023486001.1